MDAEALWKLAVRRLYTRVQARVFTYRRQLIDARGRGAQAPPPTSLNRLLEPLAVVDTEGSLVWEEAFRTELTHAGVELPPLRAVRIAQESQTPAARIAFVPQSSQQAGRNTEASSPREEAALTGDVPRWAWAATRQFSVKRTGAVVTFYSHVTRERPEPTLVQAGEALHAKDNGDMLEAALQALLTAGTELAVFHSREQLMVFETDESEDTISRYLDMLSHGLANPGRVTEVELPCSKTAAKAKLEKGLARLIIDCRTLKGPGPHHRRCC